MPDRAERAERSPRDRDDPALLAQQAREQVERHATDIRALPVPVATEPPTVYRP